MLPLPKYQFPNPIWMNRCLSWKKLIFRISQIWCDIFHTIHLIAFSDLVQLLQHYYQAYTGIRKPLRIQSADLSM